MTAPYWRRSDVNGVKWLKKLKNVYLIWRIALGKYPVVGSGEEMKIYTHIIYQVYISTKYSISQLECILIFIIYFEVYKHLS